MYTIDSTGALRTPIAVGVFATGSGTYPTPSFQFQLHYRRFLTPSRGTLA